MVALETAELRHGIRELLFPRSAAVIGASPRHAETVSSVVRSRVPTWGVHPRHREVAGLLCSPRISDLPETPELAMLLVGQENVEAAFEDAAMAGVKAFVLPGLGAEAGAAGPPTAARIGKRAEELGVSVLGPNCMGVASPAIGAFWHGSVSDAFVPGHVSVVAQSGSIAEAMIASGPRVGFRTVVSCGAEAVRDVADLVGFLAGDEGTRAVGLFLETVRRPAAFAAALEACAVAGKPVVCLKVGRSEAGARAALAHTGALVGSDRAFAAVLRRFGVIAVDDMHEFVETLELLGARRPRPTGRRLGAISESGGECALLADRAEAVGIPFTPLDDAVAAAITAEFPNCLAPQNPLDAWAVDEAERVFPRALELLAGSGTFDVLIAQVDLSRFRGPATAEWCEMITRSLAAAVEGTTIFPVVTSVGNVDPPPAIAAAARELDIPLLRGADHAVRALAAVTGWAPASPRCTSAGASVDVRDLVGRVGALPEYESALVLERYGVPVAPRRRVAGPAQAAAAAHEVGLPAVVKMDGPPHKSSLGGVLMDLASAADVASAAAHLGGSVLVAQQVPAGPEYLCGMTRDPDHGPMLAVGMGGTGVESGDPAVCLAPVDRATALALLEEAALPSDAEPLADILVALGRLAVEHPEVTAVDVNPLILGPDGPIAVDALVVIGDNHD